jgi:hypothetical protein
MAIIKRAAKRIAPKTLDKMRAKTAEKERINAERERNHQLKLKEYREKIQENAQNEAKFGKFINNLRKKRLAKIEDKERFTPKIGLSEIERSKNMRNITQEKIDTLKNRINTIENAWKRLDNQKYVPDNNNPQKGMLIKFQKEATTKEQWAKRGYQEGLIVTEKQYKDALNRNRSAYNTALNELNRAEFLYSLKRQERWLSGKNVGEFKEAHAKAIDVLAQRYERGQINGDALQKFMSVIDTSVKKTLEQHRILAKTKGSEYFDSHARVTGKALLSFLKEANLKNLNESTKRFELKMSAIAGTIDKPNRAAELEWLYRNI